MDKQLMAKFSSLAEHLAKHENCSDINKFYVVERGLTHDSEPQIYEATASSLMRQTLGGLNPDDIMYIGGLDGANRVYNAAMVGYQAVKDAINA